MKFYISILVLSLSLSAAACTNIEERHGATLKPSTIQKIEPNFTKNQVVSLLGSPSTKSSYGEEIWYYISNNQKRNIVTDNELKDQEVLSVYFNENDKVYNVETYGLVDAKNIAFSDRKTPTAGHELTAIEQLLGNVGRFTPAGLGNQRGANPTGN